MQAGALPFASLGSLKAFDVYSEVRIYNVQEAVEIEKFDSAYLFGFILAANRRLHETRWGVATKTGLVSPALFSLLPANVRIFGLPQAGSYRCVLCSVKPSLFEETTGLTEWDQEQFARALSISTPRFRMIFKRLADEIQNPGFASSELCEHLSMCLMIEFSRMMKTTEEVIAGGGLPEWQLNRVKEAIHEFSGGGPVKISTIASMCGISSRHLMRGFKAATGSTIHGYLEQVRLEKTKELLADGETPLKVIASRMGFASSAHMTVAFKRMTGFTPSSYRTRLLN